MSSHANFTSNAPSSWTFTEKIKQVLPLAPVSCCPECYPFTRQNGHSSEMISLVLSSSCPICMGRDNRRAYRQLLYIAKGVDVSHLLIVGGGPDAHADLMALECECHGLKLRMLDGTRRIDSRRAAALLLWADVVVIWGSTMLKHSVSRAFENPPQGTRKIVIAHGQRGITSLCREVCSALSDKKPSYVDAKRRAK